ncbi:hypothetical protein K432DRAFT_143311 [Lepidopterella palustris CBS 459.81]|uniref:Uncharacterized protein n=1 Tax=Lepidopterella palustris CBS 459.81 TaxID=1314670 RepID=A0A8E2ELT5_9PEZI|nr:hypothetical protein K432DRAFT_143311 [Lepidopterella palustris CBS 459.81]
MRRSAPCTKSPPFRIPVSEISCSPIYHDYMPRCFIQLSASSHDPFPTFALCFQSLDKICSRQQKFLLHQGRNIRLAQYSASIYRRRAQLTVGRSPNTSMRVRFRVGQIFVVNLRPSSHLNTIRKHLPGTDVVGHCHIFCLVRETWHNDLRFSMLQSE